GITRPLSDSCGKTIRRSDYADFNLASWQLPWITQTPQNSPRNFTTSPKKLSGQRMLCIGCQPDDGVRALFDRRGGVRAAHIGLDPAGADRIYGDTAVAECLV